MLYVVFCYSLLDSGMLNNPVHLTVALVKLCCSRAITVVAFWSDPDSLETGAVAVLSGCD